ncbi:SMP-30/gluconolactonase/LRE family protein [Rhizobium rhizoryzae]|uniref:SMP-30/gluconolactonase/LRE family protein n=1 Tax=Rhizobium rhizoryzae TaxID=451876 RepID=UPI0028A0F723|nr:SMP-30/gluconolactonase/LRE family protein [Rhizobium rhizoryzae]
MSKAVLLDTNIPASQLGEGIYWDDQTSLLWWVDIAGRQIHRYDPERKEHRSWLTSKEVSFVFPQADGLLLIGLSNGVYLFDCETGEERAVALLDLPAEHRLNDGKRDPAGRLWVGTINTAAEPSETAALYQLQNGHLVEIEGGYTNANGKAWSADGGLMFHADTGRNTVWVYDYDQATGGIPNKRVFAKIEDGSPDGLEADCVGNLYAAIYGGSRVDILSMRGDVISPISLPVPNVTNCCVGGSRQKTLFITTAFDGMSDEERSSAPLSGHVFKVELDG